MKTSRPGCVRAAPRAMTRAASGHRGNPARWQEAMIPARDLAAPEQAADGAAEHESDR